MNKRIHNIIFAAIIGAILCATAYVLRLEAPALTFAGYSALLPSAAKPTAKPAPKTETERMIDAGELSDHPAKYYRVIKE